MPDRKFLNKKNLIIGGVILLLLFGLYYFNNSTKSKASTDNSKININEPLVSKDINREFTYSLKDKGKEVSKLVITIEKAEIRDEVVINSKKKIASKGLVYVVLNLKFKNDFSKPIKINSRDYFRLMRNGNENEKLAPDYHNDPVEVQAISTKQTRVAFVINDTDKDLILQVGEIEGDKEKIELNLK